MARPSASKSSRSAKGSVKNGGARPSRTAPVKLSDGKKRRGRPPRSSTDAAQAAFPGERLIHRYANRRFYDLRLSRAVTLEEVAGYLRAGAQFLERLDKAPAPAALALQETVSQMTAQFAAGDVTTPYVAATRQ